jgi:hypothetical protein
MAIDFPNSPATNATYTVGNKTWIYDGTTWNTYNSTSFSAETLPGTTIKSTVTGSSLTSVGTLGSLAVTGTATAGTFSGSGASLTSIPNSATTATDANTASAIVARDASGNFTAGTITASLTGNVSGSAATVTGAAQTAITSVGNLSTLTVIGSVVSGTNTFKTDTSNNRVGIGTLTPATTLDVIGTATIRTAATQDGVALAGRAGGTGTYEVTLTPTTLTGDRTITLPDVTGTLCITLINASTSSVSTGYAADTYLAGSSIVIPAGVWTAKTTYRCVFDMVKTAAGTGAFTVNVRMGTLGTTSDASVLSLAFAAGTAVADTGRFEVLVNFRTVGSSTSAVVQGSISCSHALAATGLISTGASGFGFVTGTSAGFASTTQTTIGISVNGGTSFSGTNTQVQTKLELG